MDNATSSVMFHFIPFSIHNHVILLLFTIFLILYLIGLIVNITIIMVIWVDTNLHSPMYLFLANLSLSDISYTTVVVPTFLYMILSGNYTVSFTRCLVQLYFFFVSATAEDMVLLIMAYDRYVAICQPLYYHYRLSKKICSLLMAVIWFCAFTNSMFFVQQILQLSFYRSVTIHHFFCDFKVLFHSSYGSSIKHFIIFFLVELVIFGILPLSYIFKSYIKIMNGILLIKNTEGRKKAFSTSSSHLIVILIYYCSAAAVYMSPTSENTRISEQVLSTFYTSVVPIINPIIYSLRNHEIKKALQRLVRKKNEMLANVSSSTLWNGIVSIYHSQITVVLMS